MCMYLLQETYAIRLLCPDKKLINSGVDFQSEYAAVTH